MIFFTKKQYLFILEYCLIYDARASPRDSCDYTKNENWYDAYCDEILRVPHFSEISAEFLDSYYSTEESLENFSTNAYSAFFYQTCMRIMCNDNEYKQNQVRNYSALSNQDMGFFIAACSHLFADCALFRNLPAYKYERNKEKKEKLNFIKSENFSDLTSSDEDDDTVQVLWPQIPTNLRSSQ
jgi:hypothetical protein